MEVCIVQLQRLPYNASHFKTWPPQERSAHMANIRHCGPVSGTAGSNTT